VTDRLGAAAALSFGVLVVVLAGVGGVAVVAEWRGDWSSYFFMERAVAAVTPFATVLAAVALLAGFVVVFRAA
jgi:hypothetical protein